MKTATLALHFDAENGSTMMRVHRQEPPWRALRAFPNASGEALVHLHNVSGGVLGGDRLRLEVTLARRAEAQITTVGATRVYRHRPEREDASHVTEIQVGEDALLEYLPEPLIPFRGSRFLQACEVRLAEGAGLIWWETISAGRVAHGELFDFESLSAQVAIHTPGGLIALERYALSPKGRALDSPARMGPFLYSATMYVCRADGSARWRDVENELTGMALKLSTPTACWGASSLIRDGVVVRGMACHAHEVSCGLQRFWQAAKQTVWGRPALLPRKIH